ncbi:MAG TPA: hypothetical protein VFU49_01625 [Ktedonobacteraceae bacterium]|nr:hypothetical protein [Ktedonobacteraceae bacterium]
MRAPIDLPDAINWRSHSGKTALRAICYCVGLLSSQPTLPR